MVYLVSHKIRFIMVKISPDHTKVRMVKYKFHNLRTVWPIFFHTTFAKYVDIDELDGNCKTEVAIGNSLILLETIAT